jgi:hypothetical protein
LKDLIIPALVFHSIIVATLSSTEALLAPKSVAVYPELVEGLQ